MCKWFSTERLGSGRYNFSYVCQHSTSLHRINYIPCLRRSHIWMRNRSNWFPAKRASEKKAENPVMIGTESLAGGDSGILAEKVRNLQSPPRTAMRRLRFWLVRIQRRRFTPFRFFQERFKLSTKISFEGSLELWTVCHHVFRNWSRN